MQLNEKIIYLRKQHGFTQEEIAKRLYVSRTAISKWESGRGLPSIDSLMAISALFNISMDELLSNEEIISLAHKDKQQTMLSNQMVVFGVIDMTSLLLLWIPLYAQRTTNPIHFVSLLSLVSEFKWISMVYIIFIGLNILLGFIELTLQNSTSRLWVKYQPIGSLSLTLLIVIIHLISLQPYLAFIYLWLFIIKGIFVFKLHAKS